MIEDWLTWHNLAQAWVLITSSLAVFLVARTDKWHRWGYVFGLLSEPGWFAAALMAEQWGTVLLAVWWTYSWGLGAYRRFVDTDKDTPSGLA